MANPPEKGKAEIPWRFKEGIMQFFFTFSRPLAFIVTEGRSHLCRVIVELKYPHPRRPSGDIIERFRPYSKKGLGMGTASRNLIARTALRDRKHGGPGTIRWTVEHTTCSDGIPFIIN
ncbi:MAG: hypothetical protein GY798_10075 [Hyphomicrobiales bacterium]|nr:hypothetical protein [Hyphomicrobiales bacterium]